MELLQALNILFSRYWYTIDQQNIDVIYGFKPK